MAADNSTPMAADNSTPMAADQSDQMFRAHRGNVATRTKTLEGFIGGYRRAVIGGHLR